MGKYVYNSKKEEILFGKTREEKIKIVCDWIIFSLENRSRTSTTYKDYGDYVEISPYIKKEVSDEFLKECCMEILGGDFKYFIFISKNIISSKIDTIRFYRRERNKILKFIDKLRHRKSGSV